MNYYFIVLLSLWCMSLGVVLAKNGKPREDEYSFLTSLVAVVIQGVLTYLAIKTGF